MSKRAKSKEFVDSDDEDNSDVERKPKAKKEEKKSEEQDEEKTSWNISKMRRVTVDEFRGKKLISIREYYVDKDSGEEKPGRKGISLSIEQWKELVKVVDDINKAID